MIRIIEITLASFDPSATPQYTETIRDQNLFNAGDPPSPISQVMYFM